MKWKWCSILHKICGRINEYKNTCICSIFAGVLQSVLSNMTQLEQTGELDCDIPKKNLWIVQVKLWIWRKIVCGNPKWNDAKKNSDETASSLEKIQYTLTQLR
jgi:hypothetical protein